MSTLNRISRIVKPWLFLRPVFLFVVAFWAALFLTVWAVDCGPDGLYALAGKSTRLHLSNFPALTLAVLVVSLAFLLVDYVHFSQPRYPYWQTARWVWGSAGFALFLTWWLLGYYGEEYTKLFDWKSYINCDELILYSLMTLLVVSLVLLLLLAVRGGRPHAVDTDTKPPRRHPPVWFGTVVMVLICSEGAMVAAKPSWMGVVSLVSFPVVVIIPSALAAVGLDAVFARKGREYPVSLSWMPGIIAGAVLPAIAVALVAGLWGVGIAIFPRYVANLNTRTVPPWHHPELAEKIVGRIFWAGPHNLPEPLSLRCFDPTTGDWRIVPHAPAPTEFFQNAQYWDAQGRLFAYVKYGKEPIQKSIMMGPKGEMTGSKTGAAADGAKHGSGSGMGGGLFGTSKPTGRPALPPWWRQVRVISLEDGRQVAFIDISALPNENARKIRRIRISPDCRKLAILFEREVPSYPKKGEKRPWPYGLAIYELPTGKLRRKLDGLRVFTADLCWLADSAHVVVLVSDAPPPRPPNGARHPRKPVPRWLTAVDIQTGQGTKLLSARYPSGTFLCPQTGKIITNGSEGLALITPAADPHDVRCETIPCPPGFFLDGVSPDGHLLIGAAFVPTMMSNCGDRTSLVIMDIHNPDMCHFLGGEPDARNNTKFMDTVIWRDVAE